MSLRFVTAGESHGPGLTAIVEGLPAGLELSPEDIDRDLARRQLGHGRGGRMKIEKDRADVVAGVRHGRTLGSPVALRIENRDYRNWEERMNPWPVDGGDRRGAPAASRPRRPGRRPEVRPHRRPQRARARFGARDRRAGRRPGRSPRRCCATLGVSGLLARDPDRLGDGARARRPAARRTSRSVDESPGALSRRDGERRRWWRRSTLPARRTSRSAGCSRCAPSGSCRGSARTSPGRSASTGGWPARSCRSRR